MPDGDNTDDDDNHSNSDDPDATVIITVLPSRFRKHRTLALLEAPSTNPSPDHLDITLVPDQPATTPVQPGIALAQLDLAPDHPNLALQEPALASPPPAPTQPALCPQGWGLLPKLKHTFWAEIVSHRGLSSGDHVKLPYTFTGGKYVWGDMAEFGLVWEESSEDGQEYLVPKLLQVVRSDECWHDGPVASSMLQLLKAFRDARNCDSWH